MSGYVYLIGTPVFGWYKIGKSKTPIVRVRDLGILLPFKIRVIGVWKAEDHTLMEQALHEKYIDNRVNGEWFEFDRKEMLQKEEQAKREIVFKEQAKSTRLKILFSIFSSSFSAAIYPKLLH